MGNTIYGYIRVSTIAQHDDRQRIAMEKFGVDEKFLFVDKQSGKDFNRPAYQALLKKLDAGDTLVVKSLDRLGRNYDEVLEEWRIITREKGASIVILDMPLLDTRNKYGDNLTAKLIANLVIQLFSYVAETERNMIRSRTIEGLAATRKRGVKFGRKPLKQPQNCKKLITDYNESKISARKAAKILGVSAPTFLKWVKESEN